jgi:hypothetical protein
MIEAVRVLFVPPPDDEGVITTLREQPNVLVETATTPVRSEILEVSDCIVYTTKEIDTGVLTVFEDVRRSRPSIPRFLVSDAVDGAVQDVLDRSLAEWVPAIGGGKVLAQQVNRLARQRRRNKRLSAVRDSVKQLMGAETEDRIAETTVTAVQTDLGYSSATVARYDSEKGALQPVAWEGIGEPDERLFNADIGLGWKAFLDAEKRTNQRDGEMEGTRDTAFPLGRHGVLIVTEEEERKVEEGDIGRNAGFERRNGVCSSRPGVGTVHAGGSTVGDGGGTRTHTPSGSSPSRRSRRARRRGYSERHRTRSRMFGIEGNTNGEPSRSEDGCRDVLLLWFKGRNRPMAPRYCR